MADDPYSLLGIPSPEAEQVRRILQPAQAPVRQYYTNASDQSAYDQRRQYDQDAQQRSDLAQQAEITRQATLPTYGGQQARVQAYRKALQDALFEKQTGALLKDLHALDPADPEHESQQDEIFARHPISRQALSDPRVATAVKRQAADYDEVQRLFDSDPQARKEYADLKAAQTDPVKARETVRQNSLLRAQRESFARAGGDLAEFDQFVQEGGVVDRAKVAQHLSEKGRVQKLLSSASVQKQMLQLQQAADRAALTEPSDLQKQAWLASQGIADPQEADWSRAYQAVKGAPTQALQAFRQSLGLTPPSAAQPSAVVPPSGGQENLQSATPSTLPIIKTRAEYDALPGGAKGIDGKGRTFTKK